MGMGAKRCLIAGQHVDAWEHDAPERAYLGFEWKAARSASVQRADQRSTNKETESPVERNVAVGVSAAFMRTRHLLERVASTEGTVLLIGESGVGKELFSNLLHEMSRRAKWPSQKILWSRSCSASKKALIRARPHHAAAILNGRPGAPYFSTKFRR
jgi:two-component system, NtrC family, response regulator HydG